MVKCRDCGSNPRPKCQSCQHNTGDINQRYVASSVLDSYKQYLASSIHARNKVIQTAARTFRWEDYDEGSW